MAGKRVQPPRKVATTEPLEYFPLYDSTNQRLIRSEALMRLPSGMNHVTGQLRVALSSSVSQLRIEEADAFPR